MSLTERFLLVLGCTATAVIACSSNSANPPTIGDCVRIGDASCVSSNTGGGGASGPGSSSGATDGSTVESDSGSCGTAPTLIAATNTTCLPCIEGQLTTSTSCCGSAAACTGTCISLLECMLNCAAGNTTCQASCESEWPSSVDTYNQFASCVTTNCPTPTCPTVPQAGIADF